MERTENSLKCTNCPKVLDSKEKLKIHMKCHTMPSSNEPEVNSVKSKSFTPGKITKPQAGIKACKRLLLIHNKMSVTTKNDDEK